MPELALAAKMCSDQPRVFEEVKSIMVRRFRRKALFLFFAFSLRAGTRYSKADLCEGSRKLSKERLRRADIKPY